MTRRARTPPRRPVSGLLVLVLAGVGLGGCGVLPRVGTVDPADGGYAVTGALSRCNGYFTGCAKSRNGYAARWTVSACDQDRCTVNGPAWPSGIVLTERQGRWRGGGEHRLQDSTTCRGTPVPAHDDLDLVLDTSGPGPVLRGTVTMTTGRTTCRILAVKAWEVIATHDPDR